MAARLVAVERKDGKWGWELIGDNGSDIVATDGNQGYEDIGEALAMGQKVIGGHYSEAPKQKRKYVDPED